ncbi:MAG: Do family serine endopeptidase [Acidobacteria bacterium]|nr:Do family serine endopeptidase [Acidobacteriota bacterium]
MEKQVRRQWRGKWETQLAVLVTLAVGILLGTLISNGVRAARDNPAGGAQPLSIPSPVQLSSLFAEVAKKVEPAVVNISTESVVTTQGRRPRRSPGQQDPFDFFERFFEFGPPERFRESNLGSGVIVDPAGYILTNYHVVEGADKIEVRLAGETKSYRGKVVGHDRETDVAVVKIEADRKLPAAKIGNSDAAQVGDWVLAIGSPFGLEATVTAGIISYKGRPSFSPRAQFQRFIQTDAAINRGNSGGPLVNMAGEVIGINTAIITQQWGGNAGIGFALPSNLAAEVYNEIVKHGRIVRGSIGVSFRATASENEAILRSFGATQGVLIEDVRPGSPADKAGLRRGDVIIQVDDTPIRAGDDLVNKVATTPIGQKVRIRFLRDKKEQETTAAVEDRSEVFADLLGESPGGRGSEPESSVLGMDLEELSAAQAQRYGIDRDEVGLLVTEVEPGSFADEIGLQPRDLILEVNHQRVRTRAEFAAIRRRLAPGSDVVFWLKRPAGEGWSGLYLGGTLPQ